MALWQYTFHTLPKESYEELLKDFEFFNEKGGFDDEPFWKFKITNKSYFADLGKILNKEKSWSNKIDLYGNQDSNCFEVLFDNKDNVVSASFRIDFTSDYIPILRNIIEFCMLKGLVILDENLCIISLNFEIINNIIVNSLQVEEFNKLSNIKCDPD